MGFMAGNPNSLVIKMENHKHSYTDDSGRSLEDAGNK